MDFAIAATIWKTAPFFAEMLPFRPQTGLDCAGPHMSSPRILVVDDHDVVRQGVCALITSHEGWQVCGEARTGREAVQLAAELHPDIIIMDLLMPDLNGLDAAKQIRKQLPAIEVLILSGHEETELIQSVLDAGIRAFVFKSQARAHLVPAIEALLSHQSYLTPEVSEVIFRGLEQGGAAGDRGVRIDPALTAREREIIQMLAEGRSNKEVASGLSISIKTVETHRASIMRKLGLESMSDLVRYSIRHKIIEP